MQVFFLSQRETCCLTDFWVNAFFSGSQRFSAGFTVEKEEQCPGVIKFLGTIHNPHQFFLVRFV